MKYRQCIVLVAAALLFTVAAFGQQKAEVTVSLNEAFFDSLLESVFRNFDAPNFPFASGSPGCNESITVLREMNGVRVAIDGSSSGGGLAAGDVVAGEGVFIISVFGLSGKPARFSRGVG